MAYDNRPLKYMRYAIGEIILVVAGILIALQANNWNEGQKEKKIEIRYLKRMLTVIKKIGPTCVKKYKEHKTNRNHTTILYIRCMMFNLPRRIL